jgi:hypothetical protein
MYAAAFVVSAHGDSTNREEAPPGRRLFTHETFGGNGRTCQTCHTEKTGTVSPEDARRGSIGTIRCSCTTAATMVRGRASGGC